MKPHVEQCQHHIEQVIQEFNAMTHLAGDFNLMLHPANAIPDSDGNTVLDAYLFPVDDIAQQNVGGQEVLHMQILQTLPPECLGYVFNLRVAPTAVDQQVHTIIMDTHESSDFVAEQAVKALQMHAS